MQHLDWTSTPHPGNLNMELAVSRGDGTEWTRPFRSSLGYPKFLDVNPTPGQFDSGVMWTNPQFVDGPRDTRRLFYGAYSRWGGPPHGDYSNATDWSGIGMVEMTRDRFACLTNINAAFPGQVTTKPFAINATCAITVNAETLSRAAPNITATVRIELLSSAGYKLRGYDAASAVPLSGVSGVALPAAWAGTAALPTDGEVMVRAHLTAGAKLYAINLHGCDDRRR